MAAQKNLPKSDTQQKETMELKLADITNRSQDIDDYDVKCTNIQIEKEAEGHPSEALKSKVDALKLRLNSFGENLEQSCQHFLAADTEIKLINEAGQQDPELALSEMSYLEQEWDALSANIQELLYELTRAKTDLDNATDHANHDDITEVYEDQCLPIEDQINKFIAELETAQSEAKGRYTDLADEDKSLEQKLTEAAIRNWADQPTGIYNSSGDATAPTAPSGTSPTASLLGSTLLDLIHKYESSGSYWGEIFGDYFKLQDANKRLPSTLTGCEVKTPSDSMDKLQQLAMAEGLVATMHDYIQQSELETADTRGELEKLKFEASQLSDKCNAAEMERDQLATLCAYSSNIGAQLYTISNSFDNHAYRTTLNLERLMEHYGRLPCELENMNAQFIAKEKEAVATIQQATGELTRLRLNYPELGKKLDTSATSSIMEQLVSLLTEANGKADLQAHINHLSDDLTSVQKQLEQLTIAVPSLN
ncbi:hypothetical protein DM01DRAFT_326325 [Hesseltinella vesiculosa]|uniref:Uncharacterized protein n=1 Tax=Hesseltinella vesiculosa TaxID=101127 RepID=A0A1X2G825_9FUNG|nr:hypothetical protein DM01DRAFT_326325 [Hesseltinella vesiculosa]